MKSRKSFRVELFVAVGIVLLLLAVMIPRFQDSQVRARVAEARSDLWTLTAAIRAYALESDASVHEVLLFGRFHDRGLRHGGVLVTASDVGSGTAPLLVDHSVLGRYLDQVPIPALPMEKQGDNPHMERVYAVGDVVARQPSYRIPLEHCRNPDGSFNSLFAYHQSFNWMSLGNWPDEWVALSPGPFVDYFLAHQPATEGSRYTPFLQAYDPTNGLMSHGFILQSP